MRLSFFYCHFSYSSIIKRLYLLGFSDKYITPLTFCLWGFILLRALTRSGINSSFWIPVLLDLIFLSISVVVIGLRARYLLTSSSKLDSAPVVLPAVSCGWPDCTIASKMKTLHILSWYVNSLVIY